MQTRWRYGRVKKLSGNSNLEIFALPKTNYGKSKPLLKVGRQFYLYNRSKKTRNTESISEMGSVALIQPGRGLRESIKSNEITMELPTLDVIGKEINFGPINIVGIWEELENRTKRIVVVADFPSLVNKIYFTLLPFNTKRK